MTGDWNSRITKDRNRIQCNKVQLCAVVYRIGLFVVCRRSTSPRAMVVKPIYAYPTFVTVSSSGGTI